MYAADIAGWRVNGQPPTIIVAGGGTGDNYAVAHFATAVTGDTFTNNAGLVTQFPPAGIAAGSFTLA